MALMIATIELSRAQTCQYIQYPTKLMKLSTMMTVRQFHAAAGHCAGRLRIMSRISESFS